MTTEKWTDAQIALTDIEEVFFRREKFLDTRHIELLRNLDRAVSESGEYCDRLVFKDGTSLALITDRNRRPPYLYGRWEIDDEWVATEEGGGETMKGFISIKEAAEAWWLLLWHNRKHNYLATDHWFWDCLSRRELVDECICTPWDIYLLCQDFGYQCWWSTESGQWESDFN